MSSLNRISLVAPAFKGLNRQAETSLLGQEWATEATNAVFDTSGRLASRNGWTTVTTTPMSGTPTVEQLHEHLQEDGTSVIISAAGSKLWNGLSAPTDITGTATVTAGNNWQFVNYNGKCIGVQQGENPIVRTSGNFSDITAASGSVPTGNAAVAHSGRVWVADADKQTIKYSALLDETHWLTGAGSIDMSSVWPGGTDEITALAMFNGAMVVFGKNKIVFFGDGQGSALGIDPANIYVYDTIVGVGCIARDSVQSVEGGDLLFLSSQGVQSLGRLIQEKSNPINNVSANVRDYLMTLIRTATASQIRSVYSPEESFYLLSIPGIITFCFDTSGKMQDGTFRVTEWSGLTPRAMARAINGTLYMALNSGAGGKIGTYSNYLDNGSSYSFNYVSGWLDLGEDYAQYLKILKNVAGLFFVSGTANIALKWGFDFENTFTARPGTLANPGTAAEYGIAEYGIAEYSGGAALRTFGAPATGTGQYLRVGAQATINGQSVAIQQINMFTKIGRIAK
jgi:hypothetical protein